MSTIRVATFNVENLDDKAGQTPTLSERIAIMRPQLKRLNADILCLQEIHGQEQPGSPRRLLALEKLIEGTQYETFHKISTRTADNLQVYDERNLVILSRYPVVSYKQYKNEHIQPPLYRKLTAIPAEQEAKKITWERPILHAEIALPSGEHLHVINLHLKSRLPVVVEGQYSGYTWKTATSWAEGYFLASMKRVGQALETRVLVDKIFDLDPEAQIIVCGDFNSANDNVPVQAILGNIENTNNAELSGRVLIPCENTIPQSSRYTLFHRGKGEMLDHLLVSRTLLGKYVKTEIHNETLHDESVAFATDKLFPESDHAPVVSEFYL